MHARFCLRIDDNQISTIAASRRPFPDTSRFCSTWADFNPDDPDFQSGTCETSTYPGRDIELSRLLTRTIVFEGIYATPPQVIVWFTDLETVRDVPLSIAALATGVTAASFTLRLEVGEGSVLRNVVVAWVAYLANRDNVRSGCFDTVGRMGLIPEIPKPFSRDPPQMLLAINSLVLHTAQDISFAVYVLPGTGIDNLRWGLSGPPNKAGAALIRLSYIAVGPA